MSASSELFGTRRSSTKQGFIKARAFPFKLTALAATMFGQRGGYPMRMPEVVLSGEMTRHRL